MWSVSAPRYTAQLSYTTCISRVRVKSLKDKLDKAEDEVVNAAISYKVAAQTATLHELDKDAFKLKDVTASEMTAVYESRMVKKGSPGRFIYDELLMAAVYGRCPLCGHRDVSTLDHHLPKKLFPALAVVPLNLIPACSDCNKTKLHSIPSRAEQQTLHPYFDRIESEVWLRAEVLEEAPAAVAFRVDAPRHWDSVLADRARYHFKVFGLSALYAAQAAQELNNIQHHLSQLFRQSGPGQVKGYLEDQADSRRKANVNSWQTAMYTALAQNRWFREECLAG